MTNMFNMETLQRELVRDEGLRLTPYECTAGKLTIGVGRNIQDVGITQDEAMVLLKNDIERCRIELNRAVPWWTRMSDTRQRVFLNMVFNVGISRFLGFRKMLSAAQSNDWDTAVKEMLDSRWANQVGDRAKRLAEMMRRG